MGKHALHPQAGQAEQPGLRRVIGSGDAQAVHAGVQRQLHAHPAALGGQRTAVLQAGDRLCQPPAAEQRGLVGRGPAQNKDIAADARFAQRDAFGQTGDGKRAHTLPLQDSADRFCAVAVGVRFDHRHQAAAGGGGLLQNAGVGTQRRRVQFAPGAGIRAGPQRPQPVQQQGGRKTERKHGGKMRGAVFHQQRTGPGQAGQPPYRHDAARVQQINEQRNIPGRPVAPGVAGEQKRKQAYHYHRQQQIHAVMPLCAKAAQPQRFRRHGGKAQAQPRRRAARGQRTPAPGQRRPQQKEKRRVKQTVAGVFAYAEHGGIKRGQRRYTVNKAEVAVAAKTDEVQKSGCRHPGARAELCKAPGDQHAPQKSREVPQVVKRSFPHKAAQPRGGAVPGVEIQRQVERRSGQIDEHVVPDEAPEPLPAAAGEEIPADHEKKRNGHPGQNPRQQKISQRGDACKR